MGIPSISPIKTRKFMSQAQAWQCYYSITDIPAPVCQRIFSKNGNPFTSFEFLNALETTGCIGQDTSWQPHYFVYQQDNDIGLLISFAKHDSYGEYVFDWAWANAYHQHGINYYPKLLVAVPFSPVICNKLVGNLALTSTQAIEQISQHFDLSHFSSIHCNFVSQTANNEQWVERQGCQFYWYNSNNNNQPFTSFDEYLSLFKAKKRKNIIKERTSLVNQNVRCQWLNTDDIDEVEVEFIYQCYQNTYLQRGRQGYLNKAFFKAIFKTMAEQVKVLLCYQSDEPVASAVYFQSNDILYGRYWGAIKEVANLHFEACYYQGIEYAINHGLKEFHPGTQGEHKLSRGFKPTISYSYHQLFHPAFHQAVAEFCHRETKMNQHYVEQCTSALPFKQQQ